ncbi:MMPL family transporter [Algoriphagus lutimaris]|uniref:efflux RND transporter permease subunit n=1 Tax=Algoriphagus lutimaris TaxID=613197 RepID=UPI00196B4A15|nr:MMPL family transporter [Algoriphagus lutimaris]MBN3518658.1 MMPL family transporter [Algoriphagus lutimaris]
MFHKSISYIFLGIGILITVLILIFPPKISFNYDFEQFFPQSNEDLEFYEEYKKKFENDNDYLLIALENPGGDLLEKRFLDSIWSIQIKIKDLEGVDTVISILNIEKPIIGLFGLRNEKVLKWDTERELSESSSDLGVYKTQLISKDGKSLLLWIKNTQNISKENGDRLYSEIKGVIEQAAIQPKAIAGKIQAQGDFIRLMQKEFGMFFGASIVLILGMLFFIFRTFWSIWIPCVVLLIGTLWSFAVMLYFGKALDVMSVMQPTIFLIVGLSALIHFISHLNQKIRQGIRIEKSIQEVFKELFIPVWLTILTTSLGFISLYFTTIPALKSFGVSTGIGVLVVFGALILLTPGILYLSRIQPNQGTDKFISANFLKVLFIEVLKKRKWILMSFLLISLLSIWGGSKIHVNGYLLDNLPENHPIQLDVHYFDEQYGGSNPLEIYLKTGLDASSLMDYEVLEALEKVESKLAELTGTNQFLSPLTIVKTLNQAQNQGSVKAFVFPSPGQFQRMEKYLKRAGEELNFKLLLNDNQEGRISGRSPDFGSYKMAQIREEFQDFVNREIDPQILSLQWTGTAYLIDNGHQSVTVQMAKGLGVAFLVVGLIAGILFRSWRISLILLIPNIIPLIWMLGMMILLGIEFKLTTAILFTVAFGIAVDDSIHFMTRLRFELGKGKSLIYAIKRTVMETGRAIVLTTIILVMGFGLLIASDFGVTHFTGLLIAASLIVALLSDVLLLPILLLPMKKVWEKKAKKLIR